MFSRAARKRYKQSPKGKLYDRKYALKRNYGLSLEQYNALFEKQNGLCLGCYRHQSQCKRALAIDHDHKTGKVRGLLCFKCNYALGFAKDSSATLRRLADYMDKSEGTQI